MFEKLKKYAIILIGSAIMGIAIDLFIEPAQIVSGGVGGLALIMNHLTNISVGAYIIIFNIPIFIVGVLNFSKRYMVYSLIGMLSMSFATDLFSFLKPITNDVILSSVFGGVLFGFGMGIVINAGATTGGVDILAMLLKKKFPEFSIGKFVLLLDILVVLLAGFVYQKWEAVLYSSVSLFVSSYVLDFVVDGVDFAKTAFVVSDKPSEISAMIAERIHRGCTGLLGVSMYNGSSKTVLMCVIRNYEIGKLKKVIKDIDPAAFVIVADVREVLGNGFKNY